MFDGRDVCVFFFLVLLATTSERLAGFFGNGVYVWYNETEWKEKKRRKYLELRTSKKVQGGERDW